MKGLSPETFSDWEPLVNSMDQHGWAPTLHGGGDRAPRRGLLSFNGGVPGRKRAETDAGDLVERLVAWRSQQEEWRVRFQPFGDRLRSRSWRDMAADIVSIIEKERRVEAAGLKRLDHSVEAHR